jgi:ribonuclease HI
MVQIDENALNIFVDGSSLPTPRRGGVGLRFVWVDDAGHEQTSDESVAVAYEGGTNNQMELLAPIHALEVVTGRYPPVDPAGFDKVVIHTDSQYLAENFNNAKYVWPKTRWTTRDGRPVLNTAQWKELMKLVQRLDREHWLRVEARWAPGKSDEHTKRVDKLAKQSARSPVKHKLEHQRVRRTFSPKKVEMGSVTMRGQHETVRIVTDKHLRSHRLYHYMYEVMDKESPDYQSVDYIFSDIMLGAGHIYRVRFNEDTANPRIEELLYELDKGS